MRCWSLLRRRCVERNSINLDRRLFNIADIRQCQRAFILPHDFIVVLIVIVVIVIVVVLFLIFVLLWVINIVNIVIIVIISTIFIIVD